MYIQTNWNLKIIFNTQPAAVGTSILKYVFGANEQCTA